MKLFGWIIGVVAIITALNYNNWKLAGEPVKSENLTKIENLNPIIQVQQTVENQGNKLKIQALEMQEKIKKDAFDAQKVKVYVRAKDTRTCMKLLKINVINNEVTQCNQDHYVEVRNDELENFKKEQEL